MESTIPRIGIEKKINGYVKCLLQICRRSTEVGCLTNTNTEGGAYMKLDVIEPAGFCGPENKDTPCDSFMVGCCIIHFWCWEPGSGACC